MHQEGEIKYPALLVLLQNDVMVQKVKSEEHPSKYYSIKAKITRKNKFNKATIEECAQHCWISDL